MVALSEYACQNSVWLDARFQPRSVFWRHLEKRGGFGRRPAMQTSLEGEIHVRMRVIIGKRPFGFYDFPFNLFGNCLDERTRAGAACSVVVGGGVVVDASLVGRLFKLFTCRLSEEGKMEGFWLDEKEPMNGDGETCFSDFRCTLRSVTEKAITRVIFHGLTSTFAITQRSGLLAKRFILPIDQEQRPTTTTTTMCKIYGYLGICSLSAIDRLFLHIVRGAGGGFMALCRRRRRQMCKNRK